SLAEGAASHVADVRARLPRATVLVQVDEPSIPAVLAGRGPTESGDGPLRAVAATLATAALAPCVHTGRVPALPHPSPPPPPGAPVALFRTAGACAVAIDLDRLTDLDALAETVDAGLGLFAGAVSTSSDNRVPASSAIAKRVRSLWRTLGFSPNDLAERVVVTP